MSHLHRFYIDPDVPISDKITLSTEEAHHAAHVVRVRTGDAVELFDGRGRRIEANISNITKRDVIVEVVQEHRVPQSEKSLTLIQAWLHRDKNIESLIKHGTEIGIGCFNFFSAKRSEKHPRLNKKWDKIAVEACKQCGRLWLPKFKIADTLESAIDEEDGNILIATSDRTPVPLAEAINGNKVALIIGPEGDFSEEELELAESKGVVPITLGKTTYRSEVAATIASTLIMYELDEFV